MGVATRVSRGWSVRKRKLKVAKPEQGLLRRPPESTLPVALEAHSGGEYRQGADVPVVEWAWPQSECLRRRRASQAKVWSSYSNDCYRVDPACVSVRGGRTGQGRVSSGAQKDGRAEKTGARTRVLTSMLLSRSGVRETLTVLPERRASSKSRPPSSCCVFVSDQDHKLDPNRHFGPATKNSGAGARQRQDDRGKNGAGE